MSFDKQRNAARLDHASNYVEAFTLGPVVVKKGTAVLSVNVDPTKPRLKIYCVLASEVAAVALAELRLSLGGRVMHVRPMNVGVLTDANTALSTWCVATSFPQADSMRVQLGAFSYAASPRYFEAKVDKIELIATADWVAGITAFLAVEQSEE